MKLEPEREAVGRKPDEGLHHPDDLLTIEEVAAYLGFSPRTINNYISQRRIPYIKISGGRIRIRWSSLQLWLNAQERAPRTKRAPVKKRSEG